MPYYTASGIPGTAGQNSPAAIRYEFSLIQAAFGAVETTPITPAMIAGVSIPAVQITGQLTNAQLADIAAAKITGQITGSQIANGSISGTMFASGIEPVAVVGSVPGARVTGTILNTADNKIYRWADTVYVATVPTGDLTGQVVASQIAANAIIAGKIAAGAVSATELAANAVTAGKIAANAVTALTIEAGAVTTAKIAANAVTSNEIAANTITAGDIASATITATQIAGNTITAAQIAANTITGNELQVNSVNADRILAGSITTDRMTAGTINGDRITTGTLAADRIVANSISATQLSATTFSADNIITRSMTIRTPGGDVILDPTTLLQPAYAATGLRNDNIAVNGSGQLVNIGSGAGTVVNNTFITVNGSGQLTGIGAGNNTVVNNNFINLGGGAAGTVQMNGGGGGSYTGIVMPSNPIGPGNRSTYLQANVIDSGLILADSIVADKIQVGALTSQSGSSFESIALSVAGASIDESYRSLKTSIAGARALSAGSNVFFSTVGYVDLRVINPLGTNGGSYMIGVEMRLEIEGSNFAGSNNDEVVISTWTAPRFFYRQIQELYSNETYRIPFALFHNAYVSPSSYTYAVGRLRTVVRVEYVTLSDFFSNASVNYSSSIDIRRV